MILGDESNHNIEVSITEAVFLASTTQKLARKFSLTEFESATILLPRWFLSIGLIVDQQMHDGTRL
jgi:hypothetical protein